jgi:hypothetical protein
MQSKSYCPSGVEKSSLLLSLLVKHRNHIVLHWRFELDDMRAPKSLLKYVKHVAKWKIESRQNARRTVWRTLARVMYPESGLVPASKAVFQQTPKQDVRRMDSCSSLRSTKPRRCGKEISKHRPPKIGWEFQFFDGEMCMNSAIAQSTVVRETGRSLWQVPFDESCRDLLSLEMLVAELVFKNQQLRFIILSVQKQIQTAQAIIAGLYIELPEHPDICRLHDALKPVSQALDS